MQAADMVTSPFFTHLNLLVRCDTYSEMVLESVLALPFFFRANLADLAAETPEDRLPPIPDSAMLFPFCVLPILVVSLVRHATRLFSQTEQANAAGCEMLQPAFHSAISRMAHKLLPAQKPVCADSYGYKGFIAEI